MRAAPDVGGFVWSLVPYPVRVAVWVAFLALIAFLLYLLNASLEEHYTARQNQLIAEDAARTAATKARIAEGHAKATEAQLAKRNARLAALEQKSREDDDEMERFKGEKPEVRDWARGPVPDAVRARHRLR